MNEAEENIQSQLASIRGSAIEYIEENNEITADFLGNRVKELEDLLVQIQILTEMASNVSDR